MVRILQPHRIVADKQLTTSDNVDGASQIGKDCDCMLIANRNRIGEIDKETFKKGGLIQSDCTFGNEMLLTCGLSRYSAGGSISVYFNGATSTISPLHEGKYKEMDAINKASGYTAVASAMNLEVPEVVVPKGDVTF
jgi:hypothetical protein